MTMAIAKCYRRKGSKFAFYGDFRRPVEVSLIKRHIFCPEVIPESIDQRV